MAATPLPPLPVPSDRKHLRLAMGITLERAAHDVGVSTRTYIRWEKGVTPTPENHRYYAAQLETWKRKVLSE
jgi:DNA-binding XRE family transcriptional regulator